MADIFISYARTDRETAQSLAQVLEDKGWSVWWDRRIPTGRRFDDVIEEQLSAARCVIALWSAAGVASHWVRDEAADARDRGILTPALLEAVRVPLGFRGLQAADLSGWRGDGAHPGVGQLVEDIEDLLGAPPGPQRPKASESAPGAAKKPAGPETLPDLAVFRDVDEPWCPEMVVLPSGEFMMGSPDTDEDALDWEKPQHKVITGHRFAVGRYPLTVAEYSRFVEATSRKHEGGIYCFKGGKWGNDETKSWRDPSFAQTDRHPVVGVNWEDAKAYVAWLSAQTSKIYRLLSEAEWEYACRAGTTTRYCCGDSITERDANFDQKVGKTTEVGTYSANPLGLYDMHGNVWEWVEDVCHDDYKGAPDDGGAWRKGGDSRQCVLRGGSWGSSSGDLRSARRVRDTIVVRSGYSGFRVARTL